MTNKYQILAWRQDPEGFVEPVHNHGHETTHYGVYVSKEGETRINQGPYWENISDHETFVDALGGLPDFEVLDLEIHRSVFFALGDQLREAIVERINCIEADDGTVCLGATPISLEELTFIAAKLSAQFTAQLPDPFQDGSPAP